MFYLIDFIEKGIYNARSRSKLIIHLIMILCFSIIYSIFFDLEDFHDRSVRLENNNKNSIYNYLDKLYYAVNVQSTVGLGDVFPRSKKLRYTTLVQIFLVMVIFLI